MKVGNIVNGSSVIDVKRVNKLNLIQFLKEVDSYLQLGYKIDVNSARQVGLVLMVDLFKTESNASEAKLESTGFKEELEHKTDEQRLDELNKSVEEAKKALDTFTPPEQKRQTRAKKSATESKEDSTESK